MTTGPSAAEEWMALVERTLRGRDISEVAASTRDGIEIPPLHVDGPPRPSAVQAAADPYRAEAGWDIRQHHRIPVAAKSRSDTAAHLEALQAQIKEDLDGGVTSLELDCSDWAAADQSRSSSVSGLDDAHGLLGEVLECVDLTSTPVALAPHGDIGLAGRLAQLPRQQDSNLAPGSSLGLDPLGEWSRCGRILDPAEAVEFVLAFTRSGGRPSSGERDLGARSGVRAFTVDGTRYADSGASDAQVLAWSTATGIAYLRSLTDAGLSVDEAASLIAFRLPVTADQFATIAMLRAARVMWSRVVAASGGSEAAARQHQHAVTAAHIYSRTEVAVNLLRGCTAALAAGIGGADAVTVLPFDHAGDNAGDDGSLARRLARNTQHLAVQESHLAGVADPAGGSFHIESLTGQLARQAWRLMQQAEAAGGIAALIADGSIAAAVEDKWQKRLAELSTRRERLIGVNEFAVLDDEPNPPVADSDTTGDPASDQQGLPIRRLAEPFEGLRAAAERHALTTGARPTAWIAALGPEAAHASRTAWAQNLLAAAGIAASSGRSVESPVAAASAFSASGLNAAVITGSDAIYAERAAATASALAAAGAEFIALACDPSLPDEHRAEMRSAGVQHFWHDNINVLAALGSLHQALAII